MGEVGEDGTEDEERREGEMVILMIIYRREDENPYGHGH